MALDSYIARPQPRGSLLFASRALQGRWFYVGVAATGLILHFGLALPVYQWYDRVLAWIPLIIFLILLRLYVKQSHKSIPLLVLVSLQIYIFFSIPQFTQEELYLSTAGIYVPSGIAVTKAMLLIIAGELIFILGYRIAAVVFKKPFTAFYQINRAPTPSWTWVTIVYSASSFFVYMAAALTVSYFPVSIRYLMTQLFNVYLALAVLLYLGHVYNRRRLITSAYVLALGMSFVGLIQGMLTGIVGPFVVLFLARWIWGRVFDPRWALLAVLGIILINPVKNEFRSLPSWHNRDVAPLDQLPDRVRDWSQSFQSVWITGEAQESVYMSTASRTSDLLSFTQAIDWVPETIPFNEGEGMTDAMLFWIPRVLWPSKGGSTDLIYNRYALTFGYLSSEEVGRTAVGISVFTEGYWNFGLYGVFFFLFSSGLLLGGLFGNNGKSEQGSTLVCIVYLAPSILVLQALSVTLASLPSFLVGVTVAIRMLSIGSRVLNPSMSGPRRRMILGKLPV